MISVLAQGPVIPQFERASDCIRENRQFCPDWFVDNFDRVFVPRLVEHIEIAGIGFTISFTAALISYSRGWFETPFAVFAAFLYTIPSLAFFQLMVPITGLTVTSAEIALVSYTLSKTIGSGSDNTQRDATTWSGLHGVISPFERDRALSYGDL